MDDLPLEIFIKIVDEIIDSKYFFTTLRLVSKTWDERITSFYNNDLFVSFAEIGHREREIRTIISQREFSKIISLSFKHCSFLNTRDFNILSTKNFTKLRQLNLTACKEFNDSSIHFIRSLPNLTSLNITGCDLLTEIGVFKLIFSNPNLIKLNLRSINVELDNFDNIFSKYLEITKDDPFATPKPLNLQIIKYETMFTPKFHSSYQRGVIGPFKLFTFISKFCKDLKKLFFNFQCLCKEEKVYAQILKRDLKDALNYLPCLKLFNFQGRENDYLNYVVDMFSLNYPSLVIIVNNNHCKNNGISLDNVIENNICDDDDVIFKHTSEDNVSEDNGDHDNNHNNYNNKSSGPLLALTYY